MNKDFNVKIKVVWKLYLLKTLFWLYINIYTNIIRVLINIILQKKKKSMENYIIYTWVDFLIVATMLWNGTRQYNLYQR